MPRVRKLKKIIGNKLLSFIPIKIKLQDLKKFLKKFHKLIIAYQILKKKNFMITMELTNPNNNTNNTSNIFKKKIFLISFFNKLILEEEEININNNIMKNNMNKKRNMSKIIIIKIKIKGDHYRSEIPFKLLFYF